jgi:hypothetical protein
LCLFGGEVQAGTQRSSEDEDAETDPELPEQIANL